MLPLYFRAKLYEQQYYASSCLAFLHLLLSFSISLSDRAMIVVTTTVIATNIC